MTKFLLRGSAESWLKFFFRRKSFSFLSIAKRSRPPKDLVYVDWSIGVGAEVDYFFDVEYLDNKNEVRTMCCLVTALWNLFVIKVRFFEKVDGKTALVSFERILSRNLDISQT